MNMTKVDVRVLFPGGDYHDLTFPEVPKVGDAMVLASTPEDPETWIVKRMAYRFVAFTKPALPVIELEVFEEGEAPSGAYYRIGSAR
jgi:hypothetical protein